MSEPSFGAKIITASIAILMFSVSSTLFFKHVGHDANWAGCFLAWMLIFGTMFVKWAIK